LDGLKFRRATQVEVAVIQHSTSPGGSPPSVLFLAAASSVYDGRAATANMSLPKPPIRKVVTSKSAKLTQIDKSAVFTSCNMQYTVVFE
jgi:hypothetical protein